MEVASYVIEVLDLPVHEQTGRVCRQLRSARAALIVEDHDVFPFQRGEIAKNALEVDSRSAVNGDQGVASLADDAIEESRRVGRHNVALGWTLLRSSKGEKQSNEGNHRKPRLRR